MLSPTNELGPERVTRTGRYRPTSEPPLAPASVKFSVRLSEVRPIHCPSAWLRPSTSTSRTAPISSALRRIWMARCFSCRMASRRCFSSSATRSLMVQRGGVGTRRILEAEQRVVLHLVQQVERLLEIVLSFAGEAHNDVGGEGVGAFGGSSAIRCAACNRRGCRAGPWPPAPGWNRTAPADARDRTAPGWRPWRPQSRFTKSRGWEVV